MTPPEAPKDGNAAAQGETPPAVSLCLEGTNGFSSPQVETLAKRSDFMRASRAAHTATSGFVLQMRQRSTQDTADPDLIRVGFTCSKKVGNAVARNRAKRRLREIARLILPQHGQAGRDYVLIGRKGATATLPFTQLQSDLVKALGKLHGRSK